MKKETERMIEMGFPVIYALPRGAYFDTRKVGNVVIELLQRAASAH